MRSTRSILRKGCTQHRKIAILLQFRAIDTHDLTKGFIQHKRNRNFTTVSCNRHAQSHERVHPAPAKSQFYYSFVRSTRTISRKGSSSTNEIAILLQFRAIDTHDLTKGFIQHKRNRNLTQFRAIDTHDLTKGFIQHKRNRNLTTVSCDRHARSYERVAFPQAFSGPWRPPPPHYLTNYLSKVLFLSN